MTDMNHLVRSQSYKTVKNALEKDSPSVAEGMDRMSDCISASIEIISGQLGEEHANNPQFVIPMALEMFKSSVPSSAESSPEEEED